MQQLNRPLHSSNQIILLAHDAKIVESCESLFLTKELNDVPVTHWLPFIESIFESLLQVKVGAPEILFSKVQEPHELLPGFYDFTFIPIEIMGKKYILWTIYDFTYIYREFQRYQQLHNEIEIQRQRLELKVQLLLNKNVELLEAEAADMINARAALLLQANSTHLKNVLNDFVQVSQHNTTTTSTYNAPFDFEKPINTVQKYLSLNYKCDLAVNVAPSIPKEVLGDSILLKHILYQFLLPSFDFSGKRKVTMKVDVKELYEDELVLQFNIKTCLLVLSKAELVDCLNAFSTVATSAITNQCSGVSLRVYINQKLISLYGGDLEMKDEKDGGLSFIFHIPFQLSK